MTELFVTGRALVKLLDGSRYLLEVRYSIKRRIAWPCHKPAPRYDLVWPASGAPAFGARKEQEDERMECIADRGRPGGRERCSARYGTSYGTRGPIRRLQPVVPGGDAFAIE